MGWRSSVMSKNQVKAGGDGRSLATSSSATTRIWRPLSNPGMGSAVCVGCGWAGPVLNCDTRRGRAMSSMSRMNMP